MDINNIGCEGAELIHIAEDRNGSGLRGRIKHEKEEELVMDSLQDSIYNNTH